MIKDKLARKKAALQTITSLAAESEDAYRKIKESTRMLLASLKRESKKVENILQFQAEH
jgi:hypothetical protein